MHVEGIAERSVIVRECVGGFKILLRPAGRTRADEVFVGEPLTIQRGLILPSSNPVKAWVTRSRCAVAVIRRSASGVAGCACAAIPPAIRHSRFCCRSAGTVCAAIEEPRRSAVRPYCVPPDHRWRTLLPKEGVSACSVGIGYIVAVGFSKTTGAAKCR